MCLPQLHDHFPDLTVKLSHGLNLSLVGLESHKLRQPPCSLGGPRQGCRKAAVRCCWKTLVLLLLLLWWTVTSVMAVMVPMQLAVANGTIHAHNCCCCCC